METEQQRLTKQNKETHNDLEMQRKSGEGYLCPKGKIPPATKSQSNNSKNCSMKRQLPSTKNGEGYSNC